MSVYHSYAPQDGHRLKYNPFKALISPRPVGWISSVSKSGAVNLAPYSFFNAVCELPPILGFCSYGRKDSLRNIEETGEFVHNLASHDLLDKMNHTSAPFEAHENEMQMAGLESLPSVRVQPPRVAASPASMECKLIEIKRLTTANGDKTECYLILGEVVQIHISANVLVDGIVDEAQLALLGRMGGHNYTHVSQIEAVGRPKI